MYAYTVYVHTCTHRAPRYQSKRVPPTRAAVSPGRILMSTHSPAKHECDASQLKPSSLPPLHSDTCRAEAIAHVCRGPDATWTKRRPTDRSSVETAKASGGPSLRTCAVIHYMCTDLFPMQGMCRPHTEAVFPHALVATWSTVRAAPACCRFCMRSLGCGDAWPNSFQPQHAMPLVEPSLSDQFRAHV